MVLWKGAIVIIFFTLVADVPAKIMDAHLLPRNLMEATCKGSTSREDNPTAGLCAEQCHLNCDLTAGCPGPNNTECKASRMAKDIDTGECLDHCPENTFLTSKGFCKETFEINGNELTGPKMIDFDTDMPGMSELTVSFWVKLSGTKVSTPGIYFHSDVSLSLKFVVYEDSPPGMGFRVCLFGELQSREVIWRWPREFMENPTWHLISTTWSGMNRVLRIFVDGEPWAKADEYWLAQSFKGGGRFGLEVPEGQAFPIRLTSINMWNHVLSADAIAAHVKSCDAAIGNVKEWYDAWLSFEEHFHHKNSNMLGTQSESKLFRRCGE